MPDVTDGYVELYFKMQQGELSEEFVGMQTDFVRQQRKHHKALAPVKLIAGSLNATAQVADALGIDLTELIDADQAKKAFAEAAPACIRGMLKV